MSDYADVLEQYISTVLEAYGNRSQFEELKQYFQEVANVTYTELEMDFSAWESKTNPII